jgi:hypothetical protein
MLQTTQEMNSETIIANRRNATPRVPAGVTYGFLVLALCLMITDFCRLI